jgi:hypothetical protein
MMIAFNQSVDQSIFAAYGIAANTRDGFAFADTIIQYDGYPAISEGRKLFWMKPRCDNCAIDAVAPNLIKHLVHV